MGYNVAKKIAEDRLEVTLLRKFKKDDNKEMQSTGEEPEPASKERDDFLSQIQGYKEVGVVKLSEPEKPKKKKKTAKTSKAKDAEVLAGEKLREATATTFYSACKASEDKSRPEKTPPPVTEAGHDGEEYDLWSPLDHSRSPSPVDPQ